MLLFELPNDVLTCVRIPVRRIIGEVVLYKDIYNNQIIIKNNNILSLNTKERFRKYISSQLLPSIDYEIGCTLSGNNWDHGPSCFPMTNSVILEFVTACVWGPSYYKYQDNIFKKVTGLINSFSPNMVVEYDIFNDKHNIILIEDKQVNFKRISKKFW